MPLPWLAVALPGAAIAVGVVAFGAVFIAKAKLKRSRKDFRSQYRFVGILGRGAFGRVFKIISRKDGMTYALKILELAASKVSASAVQREIDLMNTLDHPNIIRYYGAYLSGSRVAIQMEFCPGGDLRRFIKNSRGCKLSYERVSTWMIQLSSAIEYIHSKDVMHRDLKPENILIGRNCRLLLADFGIARMLSSGYAFSVHGTRSFMAPEAFQGRYGKKADIYSLGCVFVCLAAQETVPKKNPHVWHSIPTIYGDDIFSIIESCTSPNANSRPNASDIQLRLRGVQCTKL